MTENNQKWLDKNTFHHGEFWDILKLVEEKEKRILRSLSVFQHSTKKKPLVKKYLSFVPNLWKGILWWMNLR